MADFIIEPSELKGTMTVPSSKSHTMRAILFAALANGVSTIEQYLPSPDSLAMIQAVRMLGAEIDVQPQHLTIKGVGGELRPADDVIQCGNSGLVLRLIGALAGLIPQYTILTGDASIRHHRPMRPLLEGLNQLGAVAISCRGDGYAPIAIRGPFRLSKAIIQGQDSQPVSGLLIASAFAKHPIEFEIIEPGEKPWIDLTLAWFQKLGIAYQATNHTHYRTNGSAQINAFTYKVSGDFSSASFLIVAALITQSKIVLHNLNMDDPQGDKMIIPLLQKMGASISVDAQAKTVTVEKGTRLQGIKIDINDFIDALPILAVAGCFAEGSTEIVNGAIARTKESDRIASIVCELKKMGANIEEKPDGLIIHESILRGAALSSYNDHRIALSLSVAALAAQSSSTICKVDCISKTFPTFHADLQSLGASIRR